MHASAPTVIGIVALFGMANADALTTLANGAVISLSSVCSVSSYTLTPAPSASAVIATCRHDDCYNEMLDSRYSAKAVTDCPLWLAGTTTAATAIPTYLNMCQGDISAVSSACSCIAGVTIDTAATSAAAAAKGAVNAVVNPASATATTMSTTAAASSASCTDTSSHIEVGSGGNSWTITCSGDNTLGSYTSEMATYSYQDCMKACDNNHQGETPCGGFTYVGNDYGKGPGLCYLRIAGGTVISAGKNFVVGVKGSSASPSSSVASAASDPAPSTSDIAAPTSSSAVVPADISLSSSLSAGQGDPASTSAAQSATPTVSSSSSAVAAAISTSTTPVSTTSSSSPTLQSTSSTLPSTEPSTSTQPSSTSPLAQSTPGCNLVGYDNSGGRYFKHYIYSRGSDISSSYCSSSCQSTPECQSFAVGMLCEYYYGSSYCSSKGAYHNICVIYTAPVSSFVTLQSGGIGTFFDTACVVPASNKRAAGHRRGAGHMHKRDANKRDAVASQQPDENYETVTVPQLPYVTMSVSNTL